MNVTESTRVDPGVCDNRGTSEDGPGIAELDAPAGAYPRASGGPTMFAHPHPPRIDGAR